MIGEKNLVLDGNDLDNLITVADYKVLLEFDQGNSTDCKVTVVETDKLYCQPDKDFIQKLAQSSEVEMSASIKVRKSFLVQASGMF